MPKHNFHASRPLTNAKNAKIAKALLSRDEPFKDLMAAVDCAKCHEPMAIDEPSPRAAAFFSATGNSFPTKKIQREGRKETVVYRN